MIVKDIAICNPKNNYIPNSFINYIDTASVLDGKIKNIQKLLTDFPSRAQRIVHQNDILISSVRPNLKHNCFVEESLENMIASTGFILIRAKNKEKIDNRFLYYFLTSPSIVKHYCSIAENSQSSFPSFNKEVIENLHIPDFSQNIQRSISNILGSLDKKIEINQKKIAELETLAKLIYDYWFVQFDFPDENGKPYKSSGGKMVYNETLKREIPKGWGITTIGEITDCFDSKRIPLSANQRNERKGKYPYYGATEIMDFVNDYIFEGSYVLVAEDGSVMDDNGYPITQIVHGKIWVNNHAHVLKPVKNYSCTLLESIIKQIPVKTIKTGSIQMKINQNNLNKYRIINIPSNSLNDYNSIILPIETQIEQLKQSVNMASFIRDWLLPMLMNGQVTVEE